MYNLNAWFGLAAFILQLDVWIPRAQMKQREVKGSLSLQMLQKLSERSRLRLNEEASINSISNFTRRRKW